MKRLILAILIFLIFFFLSSESYSQNNIISGDIVNELKNIEAVAVNYDKSFDKLKSFNRFDEKYLKLVRNFLEKFGSYKIYFDDEDINKINSSETLKRNLYFTLSLNYFNKSVSRLKINLKFWDKEIFIEKPVLIAVDNNWLEKISGEMDDIFSEGEYSISRRFKKHEEKTDWNENNIVSYLNENPNGKLIGIYEKYGFTVNNSKYKIGIVKEKGKYKIIYLSGAANYADWQEGDLKGEIDETAMENFYSVKWINGDKTVHENAYLTINDEYFLNFEFFLDDFRYNSSYIKIYPQSKSLNANNEYTSSGTGFLINDEGYILTNYHVIAGGKRFEVCEKGKKYSAELYVKDKIADLAILKLDKKVTAEPLKFSTSEISPGEELTAFGYPLIETMGEGIKLSKGIVGSVNGFLDNPNYFQLNCEIFPGNSGGPVLDENGAVKGIVTSILNKAGKVAYSLKEDVIKTFLEINGIKYGLETGSKKIETGKIFHSVFLIKVY